MAKGFILTNVPEKCKVCQFYYPARDMHTGEYASGCRMIPTAMIREPEKRQDWCPILELAKRKEPTVFPVCLGLPWKCTEYDQGWNDCLDYLEGE